MEPVIQTRDLTRLFGKFVAVDHLNMEVFPGEIFGFLGANGSGKTTTTRMLCGLLAPSKGTAIVAGADVTKEPDEVKRHIGYVSQAFSLYPELTVAENLDFFSRIYRVPRRLAQERAEEMLELTKLKNFRNRQAGSLSGGMKQKLALSCAYVHDPEIFFLDEPTAGIDPLSRRELWNLFHELARRGKTVFVTTHYIDEAEQCYRIGLMHLSKLVYSGEPSKMRAAVSELRIIEVTADSSVRVASILHEVPGVESIQIFGGERVHIRTSDTTDGSDIVDRIRHRLERAGYGGATVREIEPSLEDLVIYVIERQGR